MPTSHHTWGSNSSQESGPSSWNHEHEDLSTTGMIKESLEEANTNVAFTCLFFGLFLLVFGLTSFLIRGKLFLTSAVIALAFGIILGPKVLGWLHVIDGGWETSDENDRAKQTLLWFTRIVIGIQVLSAGVTLPKRYILRPNVAKSLVVLLGPVMISATLICGCLAKAIIPELDWLECFVIGACLAPTDPVLAASVVKGTFAERHVPPYIRDLILCESGINDGAGTPMWIFPLLLLMKPKGEAFKEFALSGILWETLFPVIWGSAIGTLMRFSWIWSKSRGFVDKESRLIWTVALALFTIGATELIGSNELLSCFFAGSAMNWDGELHEDDLHSHFSEGIDQLLDVSVFTTLGTVLPWNLWMSPNPPITVSRLIGFGIGVLVLRRLPTVLLLYRWLPEVRTAKEAVFTGWFGPMGVGAIYYALKAAEELEKGSVLKRELFGIVSWIVFTSTIVHGITIPFFLLGSSIHPSFHPKFLIKSSESTYTDDGDDDEDDDEPEPTETSMLQPISKLFKRYSTFGAGNSKSKPDEGEPLSLEELAEIMNTGDDDEQDDMQQQGQSETLNSKQKRKLVGDGSGLERWGGTGKLSIFNEGNCIIICDEEGHVSVRKISGSARRRIARQEADEETRLGGGA